MSTRLDPIDAIRAYAPLAGADAGLDAVLQQVLTDLEEPPERPLPFGVRHRAVTAAGAVAVLALAGAGAAAAGVPVPDQVTRAFHSFVDAGRHRLADPATATRVFTVPGPGDTRFEGWTATNAAGGLCVTTIFSRPDGDEPTPAQTLRGGQCADADAPHGVFAEGAGSSLGPAGDRVDFVWEAGDAVRAELRVSTGRTYPVTVQDGWLGGWFDVDQVPLGASATIVAYGADGSVLATFIAQDQAGCDDPHGC